MENSCWKCERRHVGCHVTCEDYKKFKDDCALLQKARREAMLKDVIVAERVREKARLQAMRKKRRGK